MASKAEEIQGYADRKEWKNFIATIKAVYGPPVKGAAPLLSAESRTLLTEKVRILTRWAEHFQSFLNQPFTISDTAINRRVETNMDLNILPPLQETIRAVQQLSSGKTPGSDKHGIKYYRPRANRALGCDGIRRMRRERSHQNTGACGSTNCHSNVPNFTS
ncbi:unnamed protein product [Schistocephalus solidus]|uniref:Uncharacterized protein n=1 Tax=Schistocephalus solidus TaxID=70667 RepID=A0A183TC95_SCHSO|nr:unnamed protein product [Schistocephalus solidus]